MAKPTSTDYLVSGGVFGLAAIASVFDWRLSALMVATWVIVFALRRH